MPGADGAAYPRRSVTVASSPSLLPDLCQVSPDARLGTQSVTRGFGRSNLLPFSPADNAVADRPKPRGDRTHQWSGSDGIDGDSIAVGAATGRRPRRFPAREDEDVVKRTNNGGAGDQEGYARPDRAPEEIRESAGVGLRLALDLPLGPRYVSCLSCTARSLFESLSLPRADIDDVELILGELATNVVLHAGGTDYHVEIEFDGGAVRVSISDRGVGFPVGRPSLPGTSRHDPNGDSGRFGGWGLPIVYGVADRVEILPNLPCGTLIRAEKRVSTGSAANRAAALQK